MRYLRAFFLCCLFSIPAFTATCTVSSSGVAFGNYDTLSGAPVDSSGTITVSCTGTSGEVVNARLSTTAVAHSMPGPSSALAYQLYLDAARTQIWGDGTSGTSTINGTLTVGSNGSVTQSFYVYGRVASGQQSGQAGSYLDTLVVTLTW
jgi:spore coat protein U-like protein